ncbi:hypothetical protein BJ508DRAFT_417494 [Ascobolus immersus RN42]|uniref:TPR-like protein n=1 Tax=Ascobolus immersus RN42 TaxID=1160509 RepID=A0A3N4HXE0_ASCIM|nr:hypothetical protein BJ508DRAFT_417494 [Ascobolus immersus RN42]
MESFKLAADKALSSLLKGTSTITSPLNAAIKKAAAESAARIAAEQAAEEAAKRVPHRKRMLQNASKSEQRMIERRQEVQAERREMERLLREGRGGRGARQVTTSTLKEEQPEEQEEGLEALVTKYKAGTSQLLESMAESGDEVSPELRAAIDAIEHLVANREEYETPEKLPEVVAIMKRYETAIRNTKAAMLKSGTSLEDVERGEKAMEKLEEAGVLDELMSLPRDQLESKLEALSKAGSWPQQEAPGGMAGSGMFGGRKAGEERKFDPDAEPTVIYEDRVIEPSEKVKQLLEQFEKDLLEDYRALRKEESEVDAGIRSMLVPELGDLKVGKFSTPKVAKILANRPELDLTAEDAFRLHLFAQALFFNVYNKERSPDKVFVRLKRIVSDNKASLRFLSPKAWDWLWDVAGNEARLDEKGKVDKNKPVVPTPRQVMLGDLMREAKVEMTFDHFSKYIIALVFGKERATEATQIYAERMQGDQRLEEKMWSLGVRMWSMLGQPKKAEALLRSEGDNLKRINPTHFVPVIAYYNLTGSPKNAWRLYDEMKQWELETREKVDVLKYAVVAESFLVAGEFDEGLRVFKDLLLSRAQTPEEVAYLTRFRELVRLAQMTAETPRDLNLIGDLTIDQLPPSITDNAFYSAWIRGLAKNRRWDLALNLLKRRAKTAKMVVHTDVLDAIVKCFLECKLEREALCMVAEMIGSRLDYLDSNAVVDLPCTYTAEERAELAFDFPSASPGTFSIVLSHLKNRGALPQIQQFIAALKACHYTPDAHILNHLLICDLRLSQNPAETFLDLFTSFVKPPAGTAVMAPNRTRKELEAPEEDYTYTHGCTTPDLETVTLLWHWASRHYSRNPMKHPVKGQRHQYTRWTPTPSQLYRTYTLPFLHNVLSRPHTVSQERNLLKLLSLAFISHGTRESIKLLAEIYKDVAATFGIVGDVTWLKGRVARLRGGGYRRTKEGMVGRTDMEDGELVVTRTGKGVRLTEEEAKVVLEIEQLLEVVGGIMERQGR